MLMRYILFIILSQYQNQDKDTSPDEIAKAKEAVASASKAIAETQ